MKAYKERLKVNRALYLNILSQFPPTLAEENLYLVIIHGLQVNSFSC